MMRDALVVVSSFSASGGLVASIMTPVSTAAAGALSCLAVTDSDSAMSSVSLVDSAAVAVERRSLNASACAV